MALLGGGMALEAFLALARAVGADVRAEQLTRDRLEAKFVKVTPRVVARLDRDGMTPARLSATPEQKRQLIRSAQYLLWKETIRSVTGRALGSDKLADYIRDRHDDRVVPRVLPHVEPALATEALVERVAAAELEQTT